MIYWDEVEDKYKKNLLIDAVCGIGCSDYHFWESMVKQGFARYTGNQWNEDWAWNRESLRTLPIEELAKLYLKLIRGEYD